MAGYGIKRLWLIFKTETLMYQSNANLDEQILFGKITHLYEPTSRKMPLKGFVWESKIPRSILVHNLSISLKFTISVPERVLISIASK